MHCQFYLIDITATPAVSQLILRLGSGKIALFWHVVKHRGARTQAYFMLDEMMLAGELQEPSKKAVTRVIEAQDQLVCFGPSSAFLLSLTPCSCSAVDSCVSFVRRNYHIVDVRPRMPHLWMVGRDLSCTTCAG